LYFSKVLVEVMLRLLLQPDTLQGPVWCNFHREPIFRYIFSLRENCKIKIEVALDDNGMLDIWITSTGTITSPDMDHVGFAKSRNTPCVSMREKRKAKLANRMILLYY
jgi:hypothetical protein